MLDKWVPAFRTRISFFPTSQSTPTEKVRDQSHNRHSGDSFKSKNEIPKVKMWNLESSSPVRYRCASTQDSSLLGVIHTTRQL